MKKVTLHHINGEALYTCWAMRNSLKVTLEAACRGGVDLRGVDLRGVDLRGVDLRGVDLRGVDLRGADLRGARLFGTALRGVLT